jgi:hypothetical protein
VASDDDIVCETTLKRFGAGMKNRKSRILLFGRWRFSHSSSVIKAPAAGRCGYFPTCRPHFFTNAILRRVNTIAESLCARRASRCGAVAVVVPDHQSYNGRQSFQHQTNIASTYERDSRQ